MSGIVKRSDGKSWIAANWVWRYVAREAAPLLDPGDLRTYLEGAEENPWLDFLVLRDYSAAEVTAFRSAVQVLEATLLEGGPSAVHDPTCFEPLCDRVADLRELLDDIE